MNIDDRIVERARRLKESGPSLEEKRWMGRQIVEGRISAYEMSKLSKLGYTTVRRIRDYVKTNQFFQEGAGRPNALDEISMGRIGAIARQIVEGEEVALSKQDWHLIIHDEYSNSFGRRFPTINQARPLSARSLSRYLLRIRAINGRVVQDEVVDFY